jgi:hypothetical protein
VGTLCCLFLSGGAIGGGLSGLAYAINISIYKSKFNKPVKIALNITNVLAALVIYFIVVLSISPQTREEFLAGWNQDINKEILQIVYELNSQFPAMVDENTRLDKTSGGNMEFSYHYTLVNHSIDEVDADALYAEMRPDIVNGVCNFSEFEWFVENGVTVQYVYMD